MISICAVPASDPSIPATFPGALVTETRVRHGSVPALGHPGWAEALPWLVQGTTTRGDGAHPFDLGLFSVASAPREVMSNWSALAAGTGMRTVAHAHQVHGPAVRLHRATHPGLHVYEPCDGHATCDPGVLLAVTTADCIPVSMVDPETRAVALVHAGWRGVAAGVVERGAEVLRERLGVPSARLLVHLGPAICGRCYEVGPEVFQALGLDAREGPAPLDLRVAVARRVAALGVREESISVSSHCTRCGDAGLFSHRAG
ncbi:MAG TPA: polyphenol oxidase family protein, partial [Longimicrobiales bacterium]|nr:polyphenol oxidase family protein [Longimicrobiales bacterium]